MTKSNNIILMLNCNWYPIGFCDVFHAVSKVCSGRAKLLDTKTYQLHDIYDWFKFVNGDHYMLTTSGQFAIPEVIVSCFYNKIPLYKPYPNKKNILKRDNYICQYTGKKLSHKEATVDHILPKSRGGSFSWDNCVASSFFINNFKKNRTPDETGIKLLKSPRSPTWTIFNTLPSSFEVPISWKNFI
jgi:HNH endonuclease